MFLDRVFVGWKTTDGSPPPGWQQRFREWLSSLRLGPSTVRRQLCRIQQYDEYLRQRIPPPERLDPASMRSLLDEFCASVSSAEKRMRHRTAVNYLIRYVEEQELDIRPQPPLYGPLLQSHLDWLRKTRNAVPSTVQTRSCYLSRFLTWLGSDATITGLRKLTAQRVEQYILEQSQCSGSPGCPDMRTALRMFLRFCHLKGYVEQPLDHVVSSARRYRLAHAPRGLSDDQARRVLDAVDRSTPLGLRDYAILQMLYSYGVRGGQVRRLRLTDVDWRASTILFPGAKGGDNSHLPLTQAVGESLLDYLRRGRPPSSHPEVFLSKYPPFPPILTPSGFSRIVSRHARAAGIEGQWGTHCMRHGFATRMLDAGHSLKAIADLIGHRCITSTFIYTKVDFNALREAALEWPEEVQ